MSKSGFISSFSTGDATIIGGHYNIGFMNTSETKYTLIVQSEDTNKGTVNSISGNYASGKELTAIAIAETDYVFDAWYDGDDVLVSSDATYSFNMPAEALTLTAKFTSE